MVTAGVLTAFDSGETLASMSMLDSFVTLDSEWKKESLASAKHDCFYRVYGQPLKQNHIHV